MTPEVLKEIIENVINQKFEYYNFYLLGAIVLSVLITYFISYYKEKAKNLATKEDIEEITKKVESIKQSMKYDYDKKIEEFKEDQLIKYKAEVIAELFAEWLDTPTDRKRLNQLTFEAFLWLPDDICNDLSDVLSLKTDEKTFRDLILKTRKHLLKETSLETYKVIVFPKKYNDAKNQE